MMPIRNKRILLDGYQPYPEGKRRRFHVRQVSTQAMIFVSVGGAFEVLKDEGRSIVALITHAGQLRESSPRVISSFQVHGALIALLCWQICPRGPCLHSEKTSIAPYHLREPWRELMGLVRYFRNQVFCQMS